MIISKEGYMRKRQRIKVPVINADTNEQIGEACESDIVQAHTQDNNYSRIKIGDRWYRQSFEGDHIKIYPGKEVC